MAWSIVTNPALQAPISLAPVAGAIGVGGVPALVVAPAALQPGSGVLSLASGGAPFLALGIAVPTASVGAPGQPVTATSGLVTKPAVGSAAVQLPGSQPSVAISNTVINFDFFIAPNGDDNNTGSIAAPWSITALNSKQTLYQGKKVGIIGDVGGVQTPITHGTIGGVQTTLQAAANGAATDAVVLKIDGGSAAASTVVASCNSSGVYTPRWAIIDFGTPNHEVLGLGQNSEAPDTQVPHPGYLTIDGLVVRNFTFSAVCFQNPGGATPLSGCVVKNCEIYNGGGVTSGNNPAAVRFWNVVGWVVTNNKIHDLQTIAGGADSPWGHSAVGCYGNASGAMAAVVTNNTFYNCASCLTKDFHQDFANFSYNYCDAGAFGSAPFGDLNAGIPAGHNPATGVTSVIHHNIMLRGPGMHAQDGLAVNGTVQIYNNTFYGPASGGAGLGALYMGQQTGSGAAIQFHHNIVYSINGYSLGGSAAIAVDTGSGWSIANATFNNNVYEGGVTFSTTNDVAITFAAWKSATGVDQNSTLISSTPFSGTPAAQTPSSFATNNLAVIGGVTCGAMDGSGTVGCNF